MADVGDEIAPGLSIRTGGGLGRLPGPGSGSSSERRHPERRNRLSRRAHLGDLQVDACGRRPAGERSHQVQQFRHERSGCPEPNPRVRADAVAWSTSSCGPTTTPAELR